ncbi:MAG: hypothetical protein WBF33_09625 [Candidatus Nitrosopolaris sp.]|jgi:hypothetical protein
MEKAVEHLEYKSFRKLAISFKKSRPKAATTGITSRSAKTELFY